jgi:membrane fusion protein
VIEPGTSTVFRPEAAAHRGSRLGRAAITLPLSSWVLATLLAAIVVALGAFLTLGRYARKETVQGYVAPAAGAVDIYPNRSGVIERVHVRLGEQVSAGDPLFAVRDADELPLGGNVPSEMSGRVERQLAHVAAERSSVERLFEHRIARLDHTLDTANQELARSAGLLALARQRLTLAEQSLEARQTLARAGALSEDQLRQARAELLSVQMDFEHAEVERRQLESRLPALRLEREEATAERDRQVSELDVRLDGLRGQLVEWQGRQALVTVAPVTGVVTFLQVSTGQPANLQRPAMTIVPAGSELEILLLIPSRAKGFVEPGQAVRIMYDAFPYQHFGVHQGVVGALALSSVAGHQLLGPLTTQEPVYVGAVRLREDHFTAYGRRYHVQPGMTVKADIVLAERRLIEWLMEPLQRVRG